MYTARIDVMIEEYLDGVATEEQVKLIDDWYQSFETKQSAYVDSPAVNKKLAAGYIRLTMLLNIS